MDYFKPLDYGIINTLADCRAFLFPKKENNKKYTIAFIHKKISKYYNVDINIKSRKREIVQARQIAMYFAKKLTKNSLQTIGTQIGEKDHATVLHACKTVNNLIETDKEFKKEINKLKQLFL